MSGTAPATASAQEVHGNKGKFGSKWAFDTHTVEDLAGRSPKEILEETGGRREKELRHFTGV